ncbi:predicted protein [Streptomyces viridochromogenes DSM 40736]|uniref:Predicted protein n=1 Tax=Streptomyces viridochromogenes (strain DSM 40736 / JCM 4977 / BCRC 1201 / Tue 494) TaxID=591159 RepID=D9X9A3_STRVT|nr:predicted protein [Streptomyces viridochromogenes DSM 40736]
MRGISSLDRFQSEFDRRSGDGELVVLVLRVLLAQAVARDVEAARMRAELEEVI